MLFISNIFKDTVFRFLQAILKQAYSISILIFGLAYLGADSFGLYVYLTSFILLLSMLSDFGLSISVAKSISEDVSNLEKVLSNIFSFILLLSLSLSVLTFFVVKIYFVYGMETSFLSALLVFSMPLSSFFDGVNRGLIKFKTNMLSSVASSIVAIILFFALVDMYGVNAILFSQFIFYFVFTLISSRKLWNKLKFSYHLDFNDSTIRYAFVIGLSSIGQFLYTKVDVLILGQYGFLSEISIYELFDRFFMYLILPFGLVGQVLASRVINSDSIKNKYFLFSSTVFLFCSFVSLLMWMFVDELKEISSSFSIFETIGDDVLMFVFVCMLVVFPIRTFSIFQTQAYIAPLGYAKIIARTTIVFGIVNVFLNYLLINFLGFKGVFLSTIIVVFLNTLTQTVIFSRKVRGYEKV